MFVCQHRYVEKKNPLVNGINFTIWLDFSKSDWESRAAVLQADEDFRPHISPKNAPRIILYTARVVSVFSARRLTPLLLSQLCPSVRPSVTLMRRSGIRRKPHVCVVNNDTNLRFSSYRTVISHVFVGLRVRSERGRIGISSKIPS